MRTVATLCALLALVAFAGCGSKKTVTVGDSSVTTSDDNKTTTITGKDGSMKVGAGAVDTAKLGAPVYPGATQDESGGGLSVSTAESSVDTAVFKTTDPFEKVYEYYKAQMPAGSEKMKMAAGGGSLASFQTGADDAKDTVSVMITGKEGETSITISHTVKNGDASAAPAASASP